MRYIWLIFLGLAVLIGVVGWSRRPAAPAPAALGSSAEMPAALVTAAAPASAAAPLPTGTLADSLVRFALRQLGTPYRWAGTTPEGGFDCSGFLMFAYAHVGVPVPHSTALLIDTGQPVARADARPGDLVVFTGTAPTSTTPGHAGIVISAAGEVPLRFVHSSSARRESGVKISQIEGTDYERRFMQVRRVLSGGLPAAGPPPARPGRVAAAPPRIAAIVAPLEKRPAAVQVADDTEPPAPPAHLTPLARKPTATKRRAAASKKPVLRTASRRAAVKRAAKPTTKPKVRKASPIKKRR